jgi:hypothetical protein
VGHKRRKMVKEKGVKHHTKVKEYQVNCLVQRVDDKRRRGGSEGHPSSHLSILDFNVGFFFYFFYFYGVWILEKVHITIFNYNALMYHIRIFPSPFTSRFQTRDLERRISQKVQVSVTLFRV